VASSITSRVALAGVLPHREHVIVQAAPDTLRYALDPALPLLEGKIRVWDPNALSFEPFLPWPHQLEMLANWIETYLGDDREPKVRLHNLHVEKSRQMGDTVILAYACLWIVTYHDAPLMMQHQNLGEVDDGGGAATWDSFFGKIRLMHEAWPSSIGKARLRFRGGGDPLISNVDHSMRFITGDGATPDPGRGGRYAGAIIDEAARIAYGESAHAALARAVPNGRVYLSTPEGEGNMYFRIRRDRPAGWRFLRHHWSTHPLYGQGQHIAGDDPECILCMGNMEGLYWEAANPLCHRYPGKLTSPWYDQAVVELTDEQVAAELDIDYTASLGARVYPEFSEDVHVWREPIPYDDALDWQTFWDYGLDTTAVLIVQETHDELRVIGEWEGHDLTPEENAAGVVREMEKLGIPDKLLEARWRIRHTAIGDPAGDARELGSGKPLTDLYRRAGFNIQSRAFPVATTIVATKRLLQGRPKRFRISPT
jgi:hypothetical protein